MLGAISRVFLFISICQFLSMPEFYRAKKVGQGTKKSRLEPPKIESTEH